MSETPSKRRNLVIFSDGTGNRAGKGRGTNVWQLYEALDREHARTTQLAIHDDGVGTEDNSLLATLGGAFGFGLARNVRELYAWLCINYRPGDRIYLFGFSRGAFTVRCLAGMATKFGIIRGAGLTRSELRGWIREVWFAFKQTQSKPGGDYDFQKRRAWIAKPFDKLRKKTPPEFHSGVEIEFTGVWDTVDAYGLPVDELKEAFAWVSLKIFHFWPLSYLAITRFNDRKLTKKVRHAYHAVAIDDERHTFHPVLWDESDRKGTLQQVWFSGMHSDVGGGYARRSLSLVTLNWMMRKAEKHGLEFDADRWKTIRAEANALGPMHDSRTGLSSFYRYRPRDVGRLCDEHNIDIPTVHASVVERVKGLHAEEAPGVLPATFEVETDDASDPTEYPAGPDPDCLARLRRYHRSRYWLYLSFIGWAVALAAVLAVYWGQGKFAPAPAWGFLGIGYVLSLIEKFTPEMIGGVVRTLRGVPFYAILLTLGLVVLRMTRSRLVGRIRELRRAAWERDFKRALFKRHDWPSTAAAEETAPKTATEPKQKRYEKTLAARVVAIAFFLLVGIWLVSWAVTGTLFPTNAVAEPVRVEYGPITESHSFDFSTDNPGHRVGPVLQRGERYEISVTPGKPWTDNGLAAGPKGLGVGPTPVMRLFSWALRDWREKWFVLLGSLGGENGEKFVIGERYEMEEPLSRDTRLWLYVNDATCYVCPGGPWTFYANNEGTARVTIRRISD